MTIGDRIRKRREELDISQSELARMTECSKQTIYKYEYNIVTNIPSDKIEKISKALNVTPAYLMGWNNNLSSENAHLIPSILSDNDLIEHIKKILQLNEDHRHTIYDNIDYFFNREGH